MHFKKAPLISIWHINMLLTDLSLQNTCFNYKLVFNQEFVESGDGTIMMREVKKQEGITS